MVSAKEIPPGGEGKIDVTFKTQRRKGINRKKITVTSNDPTSPRLQIEIVADLEQFLDASPRRQWFGRLKQDETITKTFKIEGKKVADVKIGNIHLKVDDHKSAYSWKINESMAEDGRKISIDVTVNATKIATGRFNDVLLVETSVKEAGELELHLSGEILGPVSVNPRRLYFGQFDLNQEMVKTITLTPNNDEPFKILEASIPEGEFKIDPWNREKANEHTLTVRLNPKLDRERIRSALDVKTDMDKQPDLSVDIHAYKRRSKPAEKSRADRKKLSSEEYNKAFPRKELDAKNSKAALMNPTRAGKFETKDKAAAKN
ncbi:DUF1573 domain-containing protein [bacterium]|nr:DUF1573 domain-containing protein [bacterium]